MTTEVIVKPNIDLDVSEPPMFKIIYVNDNQTTMEFVIQSLCYFFDYNENTAMDITMDIHREGSATVAVLPFEIAEQKSAEVTQFARSNDFPLLVKIEPETIQ